jgi:hypothetical protein
VTDLVDYLRDRLNRATDPVCGCPDVDVTSVDDLRRGERTFVKGYDETCPVHGFDGSEPTYRKRYL